LKEYFQIISIFGTRTRNRTRSMLGVTTFYTATSILVGVEFVHIIKKEQVDL